MKLIPPDMSCICVWLSRVNTPIFYSHFIFSQSECAQIISECESHRIINDFILIKISVLKSGHVKVIFLTEMIGIICKQIITWTDFKGQIKPKAECCSIDSPQKRTIKFFFFAVKSFLGESTVGQSAYGFIWPLASR